MPSSHREAIQFTALSITNSSSSAVCVLAWDCCGKVMIIPERACSMQGRIYFSKSSMPTKAETPTMLWKKAALSSQGPWPFKISCVMMWGNKLFTVFSLPKKMHNLVISYAIVLLACIQREKRELRRHTISKQRLTRGDASCVRMWNTNLWKESWISVSSASYAWLRITPPLLLPIQSIVPADSSDIATCLKNYWVAELLAIINV